MADWSPLLEHLADGPRENGTEGLEQAARWLSATLSARGFTVQQLAFDAHPWRLRTLGVVALLAGLSYLWLTLRSRRWPALAITLAIPAVVIAELDFGVPILGRVHTVTQQNLSVTIAPAAAPPTQRLIFSAHYDTKTDLLDHAERAPFTFLSLPFTVLMAVAAAWPRRKWLVRAGQAAALFNGLGLFLAQTGGAFVTARSPGAIDDGSGCAVLLELATALKAQPLEHTEVQLVFFSGEELGVEGAQAFVKAHLDRSVPTRAVNLDGLGEAPELALFRAEAGVVRSFAPDDGLVQAVDALHRQQLGVTLYRTEYPATTDARAFLEAGVPALNLGSDLPGHAISRSMHSRHDERARVNPAALDANLELLINLARRLDTARP